MVPSPDATRAPREDSTSGAAYTGLRLFGLLVLVLMLVSILYAGWISIENWSSIQV